MPPKTKITKEMIIDAAFEIIRRGGMESINARTMAKELNCSTQPILYHFKTMEELKRAVYEKVDLFHTDYLMNIKTMRDGMMNGIGLNYIRFAVQEPQFFKFLFQSGYAKGSSFLEIIDADELKPVLDAMQAELKMDIKSTKSVFLIISLFAHGYASIIANNSLKYDEKIIEEHLEQAFRGAVLSIKEDKLQGEAPKNHDNELEK